MESVASTSAPYEVAIEAKHGGKGWTARQLEHALRTQLAEDYLKPESRRHGVLVITHHRDRRWLDVDDKKPISFSQLIAWLSDIAKNLTENAVGAITVRCVGINAWKDEGSSAISTKAEKGSPKRPRTAKKSTRPSKRKSRKDP